jgi:drug/metabolite transporter (DMT)-like permease
MTRSPLFTYGIICGALVAFAANSILCRYALKPLGLEANILEPTILEQGTSGINTLIDPISFTLIRLFSGAVILLLLILFRRKRAVTRLKPSKGNRLGAFYLTFYAITFSLAYISLDTATGALILFGTVQLCMISVALLKGQRLNQRELIGYSIAFAGFLLLTLPHITAPSALGLMLMIIAGVGWAFYTLNGKASTEPLTDTMINLCISSLMMTPIGLALFLLPDFSLHITVNGAVAAIASGAFASGIGYAIWYTALPLITTTQAATAQLLVPIIAAIGGIVLLGESISFLLIIAGVIMLSGIYLLIRK